MITREEAMFWIGKLVEANLTAEACPDSEYGMAVVGKVHSVPFMNTDFYLALSDPDLGFNSQTDETSADLSMFKLSDIESIEPYIDL